VVVRLTSRRACRVLFQARPESLALQGQEGGIDAYCTFESRGDPQIRTRGLRCVDAGGT